MRILYKTKRQYSLYNYKYMVINYKEVLCALNYSSSLFTSVRSPGRKKGLGKYFIMNHNKIFMMRLGE